MKLDAKTVATLKLDGKKDVIYFDSELKGFGHRLRVGADSKVLRSWIVQYRRAGGTRRGLLGSGAVLGAEAARVAAKKLLAKVALGEDPQADKTERRDKDRVSLKSMVDEYLLQKEARVRARTITEVRRYLTGDYFKPLHGLAIDKVTRKDVAARLVAVTREHSSIAAARARAALSAFFVWAMQSGLVEDNPVIGTLKPQDTKPRERILIDQTIEDVNDPRRWRELVAIWNACGDDDYGRIIKLLILLGSRRGEIGGMSWRELDLERGTWTLPANRSKNKRKHELPLMPMARAIIEATPHMVSRDQLFGERADKGRTAWARHKQALDKRSGVTGWTVHDIRRSVASGLADLGVAPHVIEEILNHQSGHRSGIVAVYNKSRYPNEVRAALALWEDHLRTLVEGGERKVLTFPATAP